MRGFRWAPIALAIAFPHVAAASAADCHAGAGDETAPAKRREAKVRLVEADSVDAQGEKVRFGAAFLGDGVVAIDFVYTSCTTVCPVLTAIFSQVQERLGDRLGRSVRLVTITLDPARDTPERLAAYARRHGAKEGWRWLTGDAPQVEAVLKGLGSWTPDFTNHPPTTLVGDPRRGVWTRLSGFVAPEQILARMEELLAERQAEAAAR